MEENYQGYENWETWNVSLWLSNDAGEYHQIKEIMKNNTPRFVKIGKGYDDGFYVADEAKDELKDFVDQLLDDNIITDKISLHRVNWQEVIMDFVDDTSFGQIWNTWFAQVELNPQGNYA